MPNLLSVRVFANVFGDTLESRRSVLNSARDSSEIGNSNFATGIWALAGVLSNVVILNVFNDARYGYKSL